DLVLQVTTFSATLTSPGDMLERAYVQPPDAAPLTKGADIPFAMTGPPNCSGEPTPPDVAFKEATAQADPIRAFIVIQSDMGTVTYHVLVDGRSNDYDGSGELIVPPPAPPGSKGDVIFPRGFDLDYHAGCCVHTQVFFDITNGDTLKSAVLSGDLG